MKDLKTIRMLQHMRAAKRIPAQNMLKAFQHINTEPENSVSVIAWNLTKTPTLIGRSSVILTKTFDTLARNTDLLKKPIVLGALQIIVNEAAVLLTNSVPTVEKTQIFYPKLFDYSLLPFAEKYFRRNRISLSIRKTISNPNELYVRFYKGAPFSTDFFGLQYHSDVVEAALDTSVVKFDENMSEYVVHFAQHIVNDLIRGSFVTYPPNLAYFNEQLRIIELMFSKTALSAEESQKLLRGALNAALYGCEDYTHVEETLELMQKDKVEVSKGLKLISRDIKKHGKKYGFGVTESFVPNATDFVIHTSFKDRVLNNVRSDRGKGE